MSAQLVSRASLSFRAALPLGCVLVILAPWQAEAQVRRGGQAASRPAAASRPSAAPAQRPARGTAGSGNTSRSGNTVGSGNVQGNTRITGGSNVAIGNDINVVRPPAGGYPAGRPPGYRPPVAAYPPAYRPPVAVPVYPGYGYDSGPSTGDLLAAGVIAGATAGLISGAMQQPSTTTVVTAAPVATTGTTLSVGTQLGALPSGCTVQTVGAATYHRCGAAWVQGYMQGSQVLYVVVPAPG